jgi:hypothetical protein
MSIYEFITSKGILSENHFNDLKIKRGFSDETIKSHRFFSGGKYLLEFESECLSSFPQEDLVSSGVFIKIGNTDKIGMCPQLLDDRVVIPYLNMQGEAVFFAPA